MNLHGLSPAVVSAGLAALDEHDVARGFVDDPAFVSAVAAVIAAAIAELPREECRRTGHVLEVVSAVPSGDPRWISCSRCASTWEASALVEDPPASPATAAPPEQPKLAPAAAPPAPTAKEVLADPPGTRVKTGQRAAKAAVRRQPPAKPGATVAPAQPPTAASPPAAAPAPAEDPPGEAAVGEPETDDPGADGTDEDEPTCESCGGVLESATFAAEVTKNFRGAVLCRDCLLTCESCGEAIGGNEKHGALDQARLSFIRWHRRLCFEHHREAGQSATASAL